MHLPSSFENELVLVVTVKLSACNHGKKHSSASDFVVSLEARLIYHHSTDTCKLD